MSQNRLTLPGNFAKSPSLKLVGFGHSYIMKSQILKSAATLGLALGIISTQPLSAKDSPQVSTYKGVLAGATAYELPVKAAALVSSAANADKNAATIAAVHAAFELNPAALVTVVGAIAQAAPSMAAVAAKTAVDLQPKLAVLIVKAATTSAVMANPAQVGKVVTELCKAFPSYYNVVAISAASAAPKSDKEILAGVVAAIPSLKSYIERASMTAAAHGELQVDKVISLAAILIEDARHAALANDASQPSAGTTAFLPLAINSPAVATAISGTPGPASTPQPPPTQGPPFTPLPPTVIEINPGNNSPEGPGGHNYTPP